MFNAEFFPTPKKIIGRMLEPFLRPKNPDAKSQRYEPVKKINGLTILEPSAGKGDICDYIKEILQYNHGENPEIYCCEVNPDLKHIIQEKGYRVIANNFLDYSGDYLFDLIIMNPPFSNGDEHLLKAWEIMEEGNIICLLNSETLNNPYTERRKLLKTIIEDHKGTIEELGDCFADAERKTNVNVSLVRLQKRAEKKKLEFEFKNVTRESKTILDEETFKNPVATRDVIGNMMIQYDELKKYFVDFLKVREALTFFSTGLTGNYKGILDIAEKSLSKNNNQSFNKFCDLMKQEIWGNVLKKTKVEKYMTHQVRQNFENFTKHQGCLDFTKENVAELVSMIFENRHTIMEQAIVDVFEIFTQYHKENRCYIEGWKTNDKWKVNRKVILPRWVRYGEYMNSHELKKFGDFFKTNYSYHSEYSDIDKVMCYITGKNFDYCRTIYETLDRKFNYLGTVGSGTFDGTCESEFFNMRFYKKGTLHIEFKDPKLWEEFNIRACAGKNWLPEHEEKEFRNRKQKQDNKGEYTTPTEAVRLLQIEQFSQGSLFAS